jgi:hypothetical protein
MDATKIRLSQEEAALVMNAELILTKNRILEKVKNLLALIQEEQHLFLSQHQVLPAEVQSIPAKISRGENYNGLPYLVLDHPRLFDRNDMFAIRTLFWWGNFFSVTLLLSGHYKARIEQRIINSFDTLKKADYFICINEDPWQHHFEAGNFVKAGSLSAGDWTALVKSHPFIKLSRQIPLTQWENMHENTMEIFRQYLELTGDLVP